MRNITCYCEENFEADIPDHIDLDKNPEVMESIIEGNFLSVTCPACGKILKPEYPIKITAILQGIDFFFIPELDRALYFLKKLEYDIGSPERIIIGYRELVEKIRIWKEKLDDRVIEIIKYYLLQKAVESIDDDEADVAIYFNKKNPDSLVFHIEGLKRDEIAVSSIKNEMYEKIAKDIDTKVASEPYKKFITPPYVSIKKVYIEK